MTTSRTPRNGTLISISRVLAPAISPVSPSVSQRTYIIPALRAAAPEPAAIDGYDDATINDVDVEAAFGYILQDRGWPLTESKDPCDWGFDFSARYWWFSIAALRSSVLLESATLQYCLRWIRSQANPRDVFVSPLDSVPFGKETPAAGHSYGSVEESPLIDKNHLRAARYSIWLMLMPSHYLVAMVDRVDEHIWVFDSLLDTGYHNRAIVRLVDELAFAIPRIARFAHHRVEVAKQVGGNICGVIALEQVRVLALEARLDWRESPFHDHILDKSQGNQKKLQEELVAHWVGIAYTRLGKLHPRTLPGHIVDAEGNEVVNDIADPTAADFKKAVTRPHTAANPPKKDSKTSRASNLRPQEEPELPTRSTKKGKGPQTQKSKTEVEQEPRPPKQAAPKKKTAAMPGSKAKAKKTAPVAGDEERTIKSTQLKRKRAGNDDADTKGAKPPKVEPPKKRAKGSRAEAEAKSTPQPQTEVPPVDVDDRPAKVEKSKRKQQDDHRGDKHSKRPRPDDETVTDVDPTETTAKKTPALKKQAQTNAKPEMTDKPGKAQAPKSRSLPPRPEKHAVHFDENECRRSYRMDKKKQASLTKLAEEAEAKRQEEEDKEDQRTDEVKRGRGRPRKNQQS